MPPMAERRWHSLFFDDWVAQEGLDLIRGWKVDDVYTVPLKYWPRTGGYEVQIQLDGTGELNSAYVCEIPAGKHLEPQRHLYEELTYVLSGRGSTSVWYEGKPRNSFEWTAGALFAIPLNAWHQHFNGSGSEPARFLAMTTAPLMMNTIRDEDFIFNGISLRMKFVAPARYDDELQIHITLKDVSRLRLTVHHKITDANGKTFVEAETDHVCTSIHEKPRRMPQELLAACERFLVG